MEDSRSELSSNEGDLLARELTDYSEFRKRVIIRHDVLRMGVLLCSVGIVAGVMNGIVVAGHAGPTWGQIASGWFSVSASGWIFTVLFRILAVGSVLGVVGGVAVLMYAPFHLTRAYRRAHAAFCQRGWVARGCASGLTVDDDSLWIKHPVDVVVWSACQSNSQKQWRRDCRQLRRDLTHSDRKMMATLTLEDRKFHGAMTIGQLRSQIDKTGTSRRSSYVGFGPLRHMRARTDFAVMAPPSPQAIHEPQPYDDLLFWIRR